MSNSGHEWYSWKSDRRKAEIVKRRLSKHSFAQIAQDLLGDEKKKPTIWSWAKRNLTESEMYPTMRSLPQDPYKNFSEVEQWVMYDILSSMFPRLDAISQHIIFEVQRILAEQQKSFSLTAGFLDELEQRVIEAIRRNTAVLTSRVSTPMSSVPPAPPSAIPRVPSAGAVPPPPPPPGSLPSQTVVSPGTMSELRTDFEEMSLEEINALPPDFLEALSPPDRNRLQNRVKEIRMIEKMSPEEREAFLLKKREEKERTEAQEGLGSSLSAMLDDSDSLFARMRRAADDSQVAGTGTFGKFTTEYIYFYCFSCGKMNRSEEKFIDGCEYCGADAELLVLDDEKSNYTYWECLSAKVNEPVDHAYTRGKQIAIRSRWKTPIGKANDLHGCDKIHIRDITSSVEIKADPDKQFSHYLTLLRLYTQLPLQGDLKTYLYDLNNDIQKMADINSKEMGIIQTLAILEHLRFLIDWIKSRDFLDNHPARDDIIKQFENLLKDVDQMVNPESPQDLHKSSDVGQISSKTDQILNRFTSILAFLESELLLSTKWKCSECNTVFDVRDRFNIPERCGSCGKIIARLDQVK